MSQKSTIRYLVTRKRSTGEFEVYDRDQNQVVQTTSDREEAVDTAKKANREGSKPHKL